MQIRFIPSIDVVYLRVHWLLITTQCFACQLGFYLWVPKMNEPRWQTPKNMLLAVAVLRIVIRMDETSIKFTQNWLTLCNLTLHKDNIEVVTFLGA